MGLAYRDGYRDTKDPVKALMYMGLAIERTTVYDDQGVMVSQREDLEMELTKEGIAEAKRLAKEWKPK
jgi:hypothetical protein